MQPTCSQQRLQKSGTSLNSSSQNPLKNLDDNNPATSGGLCPTMDKEELNQARKFAQNNVSVCYKSYGIPELSKQKDKSGRQMIAYPCIVCGTKISWPTSDSSCSNLIKHASNCIRKQSETQKNHTLGGLGITGTGSIDPKEVPQLCPIWCAEAAWPFLALVDASHKKLLHPTVLKNLPTKKAVLKDIHLLYSAIQDSYQFTLQEHKGALYLGVDAWQSPNGFDILGIVIYQLKEETDKSELEAMPLDFIQLSQRHTGKYLAQTIRLVVEKFGIQNQICGIVSDNASNNEAMVKELKRMKWPRLKGDSKWIRLACGKVAAKPSDEDSSDVDSIHNAKNDNSESLSEEDIENGSDEDEEDLYTTKLCKQTKKLRFSPNSQAEFVKICQEKGCDTPHSIEIDVRTRLNSTNAQLKSIIRCEAAILEWQRLKRYCVDRKFYVDESKFCLAHHLVKVLNLFHEITLQVSVSGLARLANIVVFINQITEHLSITIKNNKEFPPALRNACQIGLKITNNFFWRGSVLHPLFWDKYFKLANWEPDWISKAIRLAQDMWVSHYKPQTLPTPSATMDPASKPGTGMLSYLSEAAAA
ncbi:hypothetical protein PTTG_29546 [Puccinia triticina 1-1 BBBD Race 1]|uniref:DUF659 domain-containing protein n=1 Tax=Puccinia triticina (isolate 1-1 / race 1 (BBBD)) TaxID=630390 RepID=A0A180G389_PUCT1|nr:hypothetical protein PTTG_29546 [Puccinia triticina 1-1 BBBD Race 1]